MVNHCIFTKSQWIHCTSTVLPLYVFAVQSTEQSTEHLDEHIEHQNKKDLESGMATEGSGTIKLHYEISKDQLDNLIKLRVNDQSQKQLEIELDDNIFHGKPFRTIYRY